jgi:hypothetical protein
MARPRRFSLECKQQVVLDFLERRMGLRELARQPWRAIFSAKGCASTKLES